MPASKYSTLLSELEKLSDPSSDLVNEDVRQTLAEALRKASKRVETPLEFVRRVSFTPLQLVAAKIGTDLGVFETLHDEQTISLEGFARKTGAQSPFLGRLLRYLAASGMISQTSSTTYVPNTITHALSNKGFRAGILHHFDVQAPVWFALPSFVSTTGYAVPQSATETAFQKAHSTPLPAFQWAADQPTIMADFAAWMSAQRAGESSWLEVFTPAEILQAAATTDPENPGHKPALFVDIGGGIGHQSRALRAWLSEEPASSAGTEIIFQDLPSVIALAKVEETEDIQAMPHDMFQPQPVRGAVFYYLRNILHDHPDGPCVAILNNIKNAMGPNSTILIDDLVIPEQVEGSGKDEWVATLDIAVMASLGAQERTKSDWDHLLDSVGMFIEEFRTYDSLGNSVLVVKRR